MPALTPDVTDERHGLQTFVRQQFEALPAASYGLTDEQARSAPTAGSLSVSGLLKHVGTVREHWLERVVVAPGRPGSDLRPAEE